MEKVFVFNTTIMATEWPATMSGKEVSIKRSY